MRNGRFICALAVVLSLPGQVGWTQQARDLPRLTQDVSRSESSSGTTETATNLPTLSTAKMHVLAPDDLVEIKVYQQPDLETKARIDQDGTMIMPLLGAINLGEKTIEQARAMIRERLAKDYLVNPQVSVTVIEYAKRMFIILGEVQRPGTYEIPAGQPFTLLQAIALAGGYTRLSSPGKVIVQRIEAGLKKVYSLDANSMAKDERAKPFEILPNDNITVGERLF